MVWALALRTNPKIIANANKSSIGLNPSPNLLEQWPKGDRRIKALEYEMTSRSPEQSADFSQRCK
jgi:hypothetical protein